MLKDTRAGHDLGEGLSVAERDGGRLAAPPTSGTTPAHLVKRDRVMQKLIPRFGDGRLESRGDAFTTLARSIVGQQISVKAAQAVWDRFVALRRPVEVASRRRGARARAPTPRRGLSERKVEYLRDLAEHFSRARCMPAHWQQMDDEAMIEELVAVRGIGRWTAEMFLIFHLMRPNVLPLDESA